MTQAEYYVRYCKNNDNLSKTMFKCIGISESLKSPDIKIYLFADYSTIEVDDFNNTATIDMLR